MWTEVIWSEETGGRTRRSTDFFPKFGLMEHLRSYRWIVIQSFVQEFLAFDRAIRRSPTLLATGYDGLRAVEIAYAVRSSLATA